MPPTGPPTRFCAYITASPANVAIIVKDLSSLRPLLQRANLRILRAHRCRHGDREEHPAARRNGAFTAAKTSRLASAPRQLEILGVHNAWSRRLRVHKACSSF